MTEFIAAAQNINGLSRRTVVAAALSVMVALTAPAVSAQEQFSQVQTLEVSAGVTKTGRMQRTEVLMAKVFGLTVMPTKVREGFWL